jgi:hypothetical protein
VGDLGIAVVFQQRARSVVDARVTGTEPGQPWRTLLLPQPEGVVLEVLVNALGVHELWLREIDDALHRLRERLPAGEPERDPANPDEVVTTAERSALVTVTQYSASGSTETAELSADIVLASSAIGCTCSPATPSIPSSWSPKDSTSTRYWNSFEASPHRTPIPARTRTRTPSLLGASPRFAPRS